MSIRPPISQSAHPAPSTMQNRLNSQDSPAVWALPLSMTQQCAGAAFYSASWTNQSALEAKAKKASSKWYDDAYVRFMWKRAAVQWNTDCSKSET